MTVMMMMRVEFNPQMCGFPGNTVATQNPTPTPGHYPSHNPTSTPGNISLTLVDDDDDDVWVSI